ncbi:MAG: 50S ribosomal protein L11 methyltransferase [Flavobacteriales bacterium]|nr:50S ribosomal protein L11 methyltransferase [Flavobacteriales bacterium]
MKSSKPTYSLFPIPYSLKMDYTELSIALVDSSTADIFEAELAELGFESFATEGSVLKAYIPEGQYDPGNAAEILEAYSELVESHEVKRIEHTNWNAVWESSYEPVWVDDAVFIHAPFHTPKAEAELNILVDPNMSFGTGHHPTTHMMLRAMRNIELSEKHITDFGCGSGILAIYAAHKGAHGVAIEIDPNAAKAARENLRLNDVNSFEVITGDLSALVGDAFDLILANINRNVIEESLPTFRQKLASNGWLLCAGFLDEDAKDLKHQLEHAGLVIRQEMSRDGWTMLATQSSL